VQPRTRPNESEREPRLARQRHRPAQRVPPRQVFVDAWDKDRIQMDKGQ